MESSLGLYCGVKPRTHLEINPPPYITGGGGGGGQETPRRSCAVTSLSLFLPPPPPPPPQAAETHQTLLINESSEIKDGCRYGLMIQSIFTPPKITQLIQIESTDEEEKK